MVARLLLDLGFELDLGLCLISGLGLISGSRLRFEAEPRPARAALPPRHALCIRRPVRTPDSGVRLFFRLPCAQGLQAAQSFSACHAGRGCSPRSLRSSLLCGQACSPRSCTSPAMRARLRSAQKYQACRARTSFSSSPCSRRPSAPPSRGGAVASLVWSSLLSARRGERSCVFLVAGTPERGSVTLARTNDARPLLTR